MIAFLVLCVFALGHAQPFETRPERFEPVLSEPMARNQTNYTGFVYNFPKQRVSTQHLFIYPPL